MPSLRAVSVAMSSPVRLRDEPATPKRRRTDDSGCFLGAAGADPPD